MKVLEVKEMILEDLKEVNDLKTLNDLRVKYLGKKVLLLNLIVKLEMFLMRRRKPLDRV